MKTEPDHEDIHIAAKNGDTDEVAALLSMDSRLTRTHDSDGWTPLHLAAHYGHADTVSVMLHNNAPVDIRSTNAMANTPLHAALAGRRNDVSKILIEAGADVNARQHGGWVPLHAAAANGDREMVDLLVARGADRAAVNDTGASAAAIARERGHAALADFLDRRS
jgi:ankyrin repeat protein